MVEVRAAGTGDLEAITAIYNDAVENTTGTFHTEPRTTDQQREWFESHGPRHPVIVAEADGEVAGWASLGPWSERRGYEDTAEVSVYVAEARRGEGVGTALMGEIIRRGREAGLHSVIAQVVSGNEASLRLHERAGFETVGVLREVGRKFGRLLDVRVMQLIC